MSKKKRSEMSRLIYLAETARDDIERQNDICEALKDEIHARDELLRRINRAYQSGDLGGLIAALGDVQVILGETLDK